MTYQVHIIITPDGHQRPFQFTAARGLTSYAEALEAANHIAIHGTKLDPDQPDLGISDEGAAIAALTRKLAPLFCRDTDIVLLRSVKTQNPPRANFYFFLRTYDEVIILRHVGDQGGFFGKGYKQGFTRDHSFPLDSPVIQHLEAITVAEAEEYMAQATAEKVPA